MRQIQVNYKSGKTIKINYTDNVKVDSKGEKMTGIDIDGAIGGHHTLFWGFEDVESVTVVSVGWQRVFEYLIRLPLRLWSSIRSKT